MRLAPITPYVGGLYARLAENLIISLPKAGGFVDYNGDGSAWRHADNQSAWRRDIKKGQWSGTWRRKSVNAIRESI